MGILNKVGTTKTYKLSIEQLKELIISDLGYTPKSITITESKKCVSSDVMDRYDSVYAFDGLVITVED